MGKFAAASTSAPIPCGDSSPPHVLLLLLLLDAEVESLALPDTPGWCAGGVKVGCDGLLAPVTFGPSGTVLPRYSLMWGTRRCARYVLTYGTTLRAAGDFLRAC